MDILQKNIRLLRSQNGYTQQELADLLKIKRSSIGAYEEGRARPNIDVQKDIAKIFGVSLDLLLTRDLSGYLTQKLKLERKNSQDMDGKMRVLSITVDREGNENIEFVSQKASAGYTSGYSDLEYIETLPKFRLPFLPPATYRAFELTGDSMLPLQPGSIVIAEYITNWEEIKDGSTYVVLTASDGVVYKRVFTQPDRLVLRSDNPSYSPVEVLQSEVFEIWKAVLFITRASTEQTLSLHNLTKMVLELQQEVFRLKTQP